MRCFRRALPRWRSCGRCSLATLVEPAGHGGSGCICPTRSHLGRWPAHGACTEGRDASRKGLTRGGLPPEAPGRQVVLRCPGAASERRWLVLPFNPPCGAAWACCSGYATTNEGGKQEHLDAARHPGVERQRLWNQAPAPRARLVASDGCPDGNRGELWRTLAADEGRCRRSASPSGLNALIGGCRTR